MLNIVYIVMYEDNNEKIIWPTDRYFYRLLRVQLNCVNKVVYTVLTNKLLIQTEKWINILCY